MRIDIVLWFTALVMLLHDASPVTDTMSGFCGVGLLGIEVSEIPECEPCAGKAMTLHVMRMQTIRANVEMNCEVGLGIGFDMNMRPP
ncbi:hypothetical protein, partial [Bifidobacterium sp.]|uniref:hypothetical protein n=1 Tax=Bifidobacterium sp. TaxID=41200 RepID=UPI002A913FBC